MPHELTNLRERFSHLLVLLFWAHVPVLGLAAVWNGRMSPAMAMLIGAIIAATYQGIRQKYRTARPARYASAVLLVAEPALLLLLFAGHPWQMDMHMYFFAMLALTIAWFDRSAILLASGLIAVHHMMLLYLLPAAVFPGQGDLSRVALHAAIVLFQAGVLVFVSDMVRRSFRHISLISNELAAKGKALEERTREAEDASHAKSLFLANMSHEIRTPINAILGFCHLVQRSPLDPKQRDYVTKINSAGVALLRLINDILDFSKIEENKLTLEDNPFDLRNAIASQIQLVSESAIAKTLQIDMHVDDQVPVLLVGDEMRLNQVILNLLSNAIKFSERGAITLRVRLGEQDKDRVRIQCSVSDNGIGMTAEQIGRLFTSFTQADSSTTRRFGGTGLGLAISRQIVEQMGGWIKAESLPDVGSVFTFEVSLGVDRAGTGALFRLTDQMRGMRVLVVDDNPTTLQIIAALFQRWGMGVDLATSGDQALRMMERDARTGCHYDLLLIDWKMPDMDGLQTVRAMRANKTIMHKPEAVIMTAYDLADAMHAGQPDDIRAFIPKPVTAEDLFRVMGRAENHARSEESHSTLPAGSAPPFAPASTMVLTPARSSGHRVLLVDDNEINREIAYELLIDAGMVVDCAENGLIACAKVAEHGTGYAAVLMDVQMPEMDGISATREIRRHHSADHLPIIAMTAHAYAQERQHCLDSGMNDHLPKPVDPALLLRTLQGWIAWRQFQPGISETEVSQNMPANVAVPMPVNIPDGLPTDLPPFNLERALIRVNGKASLLRRLIVDFGRQHADTSQELAHLLLEGRTEAALRLVHNLKGVSAALEIADVPAIAAQIEHLLDGAAPDGIAPLQERLSAALSAAIEAASWLEAPTEADSPTFGQTMNAPDIRVASEALRQHIDRHSLSAIGAFDDLADAMGLDRIVRVNHPLGLALQRLDYDAALIFLEGMEAGIVSGATMGSAA